MPVIFSNIFDRYFFKYFLTVTFQIFLDRYFLNILDHYFSKKNLTVTFQIFFDRYFLMGKEVFL